MDLHQNDVPDRIRKAVDRGLADWVGDDRDLDAELVAYLWDKPAKQALKARLNGHSARGKSAEPVVRSLPRRRQVIDSEHGDPPIPQFDLVQEEVTFWQVLKRLLNWLYLIIYVVGGNLVDKLLRRQTVQREASRLRRGLEQIGGTFVKFGQQVAMRIDLVPWEYSIELSKMLDKMTPFPLEHCP